MMMITSLWLPTIDIETSVSLELNFVWNPFGISFQNLQSDIVKTEFKKANFANIKWATALLHNIKSLSQKVLGAKNHKKLPSMSIFWRLHSLHAKMCLKFPFPDYSFLPKYFVETGKLLLSATSTCFFCIYFHRKVKSLRTAEDSDFRATFEAMLTPSVTKYLGKGLSYCCGNSPEYWNKNII